MIDLSRFKAIIFDFDGVIVDSESLYTRSWVQLADELGIKNNAICGERVSGRIDRDLVVEFFPDVADRQACLERKWAIDAERESRGEMRPIRGVVDFIHRCAQIHILAICSSSHSDDLHRRLELTGLAPMFQVIRGRIDGVPHKPAPDLYLRTLAALRLDAPYACAIEDSATGVAAADAAGLFTIQFLHEGISRAPGADEVIQSFDELQQRR
jgi:HAD superfamily hydrolase (TIGR01509 family)